MLAPTFVAQQSFAAQITTYLLREKSSIRAISRMLLPTALRPDLHRFLRHQHEALRFGVPHVGVGSVQPCVSFAPALTALPSWTRPGGCRSFQRTPSQAPFAGAPLNGVMRTIVQERPANTGAAVRWRLHGSQREAIDPPPNRAACPDDAVALRGGQDCGLHLV